VPARQSSLDRALPIFYIEAVRAARRAVAKPG
jgi:hypothetical protein